MTLGVNSASIAADQYVITVRLEYASYGKTKSPNRKRRREFQTFHCSQSNTIDEFG